MVLSQGIPLVDDYQKLLNDDLFLHMESFSNTFLRKFALPLKKYRWVSDPLHQWSRQWEYPFAYSYIQEHIRVNGEEGDLAILDAGSGVTFFPYYIASTFQGIVKATCCDSDKSLEAIFQQINSGIDTPVEFQLSDICQLPYKSSSFDIVYCISVLEHMAYFEQVIREFKRVLKPSGLLIITFDISIDGDADIRLDRAGKLIESLKNHLSPSSEFNAAKCLNILGETDSPILTTEYIKRMNKEELLPWKKGSFSSTVKNLLTLQMPKRHFHNLTCFCRVLIKIV
ncbi:MAG TPA: hypothetical protein DIT39_06910 [Tissierellales bacterium]|nr:hypothetical protein [Tissierellales bacterium]